MKAGGRDRLLFFAAALAGAVVWWAFARGSSAFDAFDSPGYWALGLPLCALACTALAYAGARSAWRWPCVVFGAQFVTAIAGRGGDPGNLFPLTILVFGGLAAAHLVPAYVGVGLRRLIETRKRQALDEAVRKRAFAAQAATKAAPAPHSETTEAVEP